MEGFSAGTLAGAGSFRCESCGFAITLGERDALPACPHCHNGEFKRASIFGDFADTEPIGTHEVEHPDWLDGAREAMVKPGDYLAYHDGTRVRVVPIDEGWTRLGRSLSAHIRFDDPTVSRRHAMIHCEDDRARILDDRSLNGVLVNGERVEWHELEDGDQITIGRFHVHFICAKGAAGDAEQVEELGAV